MGNYAGEAASSKSDEVGGSSSSSSVENVNGVVDDTSDDTFVVISSAEAASKEAELESYRDQEAKRKAKGRGYSKTYRMKESERISQMEKDLKEANRRIVELEAQVTATVYLRVPFLNIIANGGSMVLMLLDLL